MLGWLLLAPLAWVLGELIICCSPIVYERESIPVAGLPARPLTVAEVAELNRALESDYYVAWMSFASFCLAYEHFHAVPLVDGGVELVHVYPILCWGKNRSKADVDKVVQNWLVVINQKGGSQP